MQPKQFLKAGILAAVIVVCAVVSWELWLRQKGYDIAFDDDEMLWSNKRSLVYQPSNEATVFIGSSRIKFDLDIDEWRKVTGEDAVQLAMQGNSPRPILYDLADDKDFKGKLVIDITEGLFFSPSPNNLSEPEARVEYYKKWSPSQRASFKLNKIAESNLVLLEKNFLSLNAMLKHFDIPDRPGVFKFPDFPFGFHRVTYDRQAKMTESFVADTVEQNKVKDIWKFFSKLSKEKPLEGKPLDSIIMTVKVAIDKIKARGGQVMFVRTPSSGPFWGGEQKAFPREKYWNHLLAMTNTQGVHFSDYPALANFICPEFSHLTPKDATVFTRNFIQILEEKGWKFSKKSTTN
ncbi:MAG: hypothetical protein ACXWV9_03830 [Flavisolibacter sp.]